MKRYLMSVSGVDHIVQAKDDDTANRLGYKPIPKKKATRGRSAANKGGKADNKSTDTDADTDG